MAAFLFKTEPSTYSFQRLMRDKRTVWDGVSNPLALKHLRTVRKGDAIVIYHTGDERQAVGLARAVSDPYPDRRAKDPKLAVVEIEVDRPFLRPVTLDAVKNDEVLETTDLARLPRLSVMPLNPRHMARIRAMAGIPS